MFVRAGGRGYHDNKITNDPCKRWADDEEWPKKDQEKTRRRLKQAGASWPRTAAARRAAGRRGTTPPCTYTLIQNLEFYLEILVTPTEDGRSTSVFLLWWQLSQGWMANFPAFIASKFFDLWNIPQIKCENLRHILMYKKMYDNFENVFLCKRDWWFTE